VKSQLRIIHPALPKKI